MTIPSILHTMYRTLTLVEDLEEKLGLLELTTAMAYNAKCNYSDTFGMVKYWETIIYNFLKRTEHSNTTTKIKTELKHIQIVGAYVKEPLVGKHDWVMSFDLNSLYPTFIMQYNISPETMIKGGQRMDVTCSEDA